MITDIARMLDGYSAWLRQKTNLREIKDLVEITTPFLDRHNDMIQLYARKEGETFFLSDMGQTLDDLAADGCRIDTPKRMDLLNTTLNGFAVRDTGGKLEVEASPDNFSIRKHNLVQAILAVNDLFYLSQPYVASFFVEDVQSWLDLNDIRYVTNAKFTGKTGFDHRFDFTIPKSRIAPERLIRAINNPTKDAAEAFVFAWFDTKEVRPENSEAIAILNDQERRIPSSVREALESYDIRAVSWGSRDQTVTRLVQ